MYIMEREPDEYVPICILDHQVGDCFLAALIAYFNYLYGIGYELMQFSWYFVFEKESLFQEIKLINFDEVSSYVANRFGIGLFFLNNFLNMNIEKLVQNELKQGRAVGVTVDYNRCGWTRGIGTKDYIYHFILLIGYSNEYYWCVDNVATSVQMIKKKLVEETAKEMLLFVSIGGFNPIYDYRNSFLTKDYWEKRKRMIYDIIEMKKHLHDNLIENELYFIVSKLRLIANNYNDFGFFLKEIADVNECEKCVANLEKSFKMLSFACLKLVGRKKSKIDKMIDEYIEAIIKNEMELRTCLKGYNKNNEFNVEI